MWAERKIKASNEIYGVFGYEQLVFPTTNFLFEGKMKRNRRNANEFLCFTYLICGSHRTKRNLITFFLCFFLRLLRIINYLKIENEVITKLIDAYAKKANELNWLSASRAMTVPQTWWKCVRCLETRRNNIEAVRPMPFLDIYLNKTRSAYIQQSRKHKRTAETVCLIERTRLTVCLSHWNPGFEQKENISNDATEVIKLLVKYERILYCYVMQSSKVTIAAAAAAAAHKIWSSMYTNRIRIFVFFFRAEMYCWRNESVKRVFFFFKTKSNKSFYVKQLSLLNRANYYLYWKCPKREHFGSKNDNKMKFSKITKIVCVYFVWNSSETHRITSPHWQWKRW